MVLNTTCGTLGANLPGEDVQDHTESQTRGPGADRGAVRRVHVGPDGPGGAGLKEGAAAYQRGDYATAFRELRPLAEQGDAIVSLKYGNRLRLERPLR